MKPRVLALSVLVLAAPQLRSDEYSKNVLADKPIAYWRFDDSEKSRVPSGPSKSGASKSDALAGQAERVTLDEAGPRPNRYPDFAAKNVAARFRGDGGRIAIADPGEESVFDFDNGDSITIEAWIALDDLRDGAHVYVIGKGRTGNAGFPAENHNWSMRMTADGGVGKLSFLFRDRDNRPAKHPEFSQDWHRWTTKKGVAPDGRWHHVALSYTFGESSSVRGYIDGQSAQGVWDLGGATAEPPVVDNDEVWIGTSLRRNPASSFDGLIDEVAIHRRILDAETIRRRFHIDPSVPEPHRAPPPGLIASDEIPKDRVVARILEGKLSQNSWKLPGSMKETDRFQSDALAFTGVPRKYSANGVIVDRSNPFVLQSALRLRLDAGKHRFLVRSFSSARLWIDGREVAQTTFQTRNADGHEEVPEVPAVAHPLLRPLPPGHREQLIELELDAGEHEIQLEATIGGKGLRPEVGELTVAVSKNNGPFVIVGHGDSRTLDDEMWGEIETRTSATLAELNRERRRAASASVEEYWQKRHEIARRFVASLPPINVQGLEDRGALDVDTFIDRRLEAAEVKPAEIVDDWTFLRRSSLDVRGVVPTPQEIDAFFLGLRDDRRERWIDRLLDDDAWADHWVGYWQDVLAENPGILKPKLNNSGPFRWWIHESFADNQPIDRFVTELVRMGGSTYGGGPAGFRLATQNDVPMAAKAHILGTAFLGVQMKCARCHDAPFHPWEQKDLFQLAAMLGREAQSVPETSSIPRSPQELDDLAVNVTLKPGSRVKPRWPFTDFTDEKSIDKLVDTDADSRERLAALITAPRNRRFAKVIVNRLWKRLMGHGLVEPVDDWGTNAPSHPDLLEWLSRELLRSGYDLKHVARLILLSDAYQRETQPDTSGGDPDRVPDAEDRLFRGPIRRRMTAEQVVDSLFRVVDKPLASEELNLDVDGRRPITAFLNLGSPGRAWEFTSLSNERDRPALSMPVAQSITDVLKAFGWRETRQDPITVREETSTVIQPLILANGTVAHRVTTLSDGAAITRLAQETQSVELFVRRLFLRVLTRPPTKDELELFVALLEEGYESRQVNASKDASKASKTKPRHSVSWSNHLSAEATRIKLEMERRAREGDPPTEWLTKDWRERGEDALWALLNTPEFLFVP